MNVMLCTPYSEKAINNLTFPLIAQIKYDGARILAFNYEDRLSLYTRSGKMYIHLYDLAESLKNLPAGYVYDGELIFNGYDRKTSNGLANKSIKGTISQDEAKTAQVTLWDAIPIAKYQYGMCLTHYKDRFNFVLNHVNHPMIRSAVTLFDIQSIEAAQKIYQDALELDYEGIVLKEAYSPWQGKRVPYQVKMKAENTIDLRVIDMVEGNGKNANMMGSLHCVSDDGKIDVWVGGGFKDSQRIIWWSTDLTFEKPIIEIKYNQLIQDKRTPDKYSLFLPRFVKQRFDKTQTTTLEEVK